MRSCTFCKKKIPKGSSGHLFQVPKDSVKREKWNKICGTNFPPNSFLCSDHFLPTSIIWTGKVRLMPNAEPYIQKMDSSSMDISITESDLSGCHAKTAVPEFPAIGTENYYGPFSLFTWEEFTTSAKPVEKSTKDQSTQTDPSMFENDVSKYREKVRQMETEIKDLEVKLLQTNKAVEAMKNIFTEGQVRKLMSPGRIAWSWRDISNAICLHASGPRAYRHLCRKGFPLPCVRTLQDWCRKVKIDEGILTSCLQFMRQATELTLEEKVCVLVFDEMKVAETFEYDQINDKVRKPANFVQVVMARGLKKAWKQPIFYDFDCKMTQPLLHEIIISLHSSGFPVVAIVCDMGPTNRKLWTELGVTIDKPWFPSPVNPKEKIFSFADAPHLLKLIRNHFLDTGFFVKGELLSSRTIVELLKLTAKSDASITYKITDEHIAVKGAGRQKVKLAAQLFSSTTANAIRRCDSLGMDIYKPVETADFFQTVNDWFDVLNSKLCFFNYPGKQPYGIDLDIQNSVLEKMNDLMSVPIIPGKSSLEIFQRGVLMTNRALKMLLEYVKTYEMKYILTNRINQDVLENFFSAIRSKGGFNDHPSPKEFKYRLRKYVLAKNTELLGGTGNAENDTTDWLNNTSAQEITQEQGDLVEDLIPNETEEFQDLNKMEFVDIGALQEDALEYIAGYLIKKLNLEGYECEENSYTWVDQISKGSLKKPSYAFLEEIKKLEMVFERVNGKEILHCRSIKQKLLEQSKGIDIPEDIKKMFFKCRIYFRIRNLNKKLKIKKSKQRLMGFSKMLKIKL